jgi:hypothetical protein
VNATDTDVFPRDTLVIVGASGAAAGTMATDAGDGSLVPIALVAATVHVYVLPLVSELTVIGDAAPVLLPDVPPLLDVHDAEYDRTANPPSSEGALKVTTICALPRVTEGWAGALGAAPGTTGRDGSDAPLVPTALVAVTVQV